LCDGILDASILTIYEGRWRAPDKHEPKWLEHQAGKVERAFAFLEAAPPALPPAGELPHVGQITLACTLGYRDFDSPAVGVKIILVSSRGLMIFILKT
jgi:hypothetical protein